MGRERGRGAGGWGAAAACKELEDGVSGVSDEEEAEVGVGRVRERPGWDEPHGGRE